MVKVGDTFETNNCGKCEVCESTINSGEVYFDVQVWEMTDDEGHEEAEITMCAECKTNKIGN